MESLNMKNGPEASVLHAYLSQAKNGLRSREWVNITIYEKRTRSRCPPYPLVLGKTGP